MKVTIAGVSKECFKARGDFISGRVHWCLTHRIVRMPPIPIHTLPARSGVAVNLSKGKVVKIVNTHGKQVVDLWALNASNPGEVLSTAHTHGSNCKLTLDIGDTLFTNESRPMIVLTEDTSPGAHDTLISACDTGRYRSLGAGDDHANCADNYRKALRELKIPTSGLNELSPPAPLNLFMNVAISDDRKLIFGPPSSESGQYVCFKSLMDVLIVLSACPMDLRPTNNFKPTEIQYVIVD